ncbi:MAG: DUF192 domain-containing protein [SAR324 cluster bacterium]|nr:DUF192 domain-containing protein [SAR324 cluster bacterium]
MRLVPATIYGWMPWVVLGLLLAAWPPATAAQNAISYGRARVELGGQTFVVDLAASSAAQSLGLGGRAHLGPQDGMLFVYFDKERRSFWMKGMVIPIDIIWLDDNRIIHIEHGVPPPAPGTPLQKLPTYAAPDPANGVLEIAAGRAAQLGVRVGDSAQISIDYWAWDSSWKAQRISNH